MKTSWNTDGLEDEKQREAQLHRRIGIVVVLASLLTSCAGYVGQGPNSQGPVAGMWQSATVQPDRQPREAEPLFQGAQAQAAASRAHVALAETLSSPGQEQLPAARQASRLDRSGTAESAVMVLGLDPEGCTWVQASASVAFGEQDTKHQALAQAVTEARARALTQVAGVQVRDRFLNFQQESSLRGQAGLTESLLRITQLGRVVKEEQPDAGPVDLPGCRGCRFAATIKSCILPVPEQSDKGFRVDVDLSRTRWVVGDEGWIRVTSTKDAFLYLYNVDLEGNASLLFPNDYAQENRVTAGEPLIYPSEELRRRGLQLMAGLRPGATMSAEMIRAIASKTPLPRTIYDPTAPRPPQKSAQTIMEIQGEGTFLMLLHKLQQSDYEWVDDAEPFMIFKE